MTLSHYDLELPITLSTGIVNVLVFEDADKFYYYSNQLKCQCDGGSGGFSLFSGDKALNLKEIKFISDYYCDSFSDKKMQNGIVNSLQHIVDNKLLAEFAALQENIFSFFDKLNSETDFPIEFGEESGIQPLLKAYGLRWAEDGEILLERLVSMINICVALFKTKCFAFANLKCFLSENALIKLYKEVRLMDVSLLLFENVCREKLDGEIITVIDKDFCQFIA